MNKIVRLAKNVLARKVLPRWAPIHARILAKEVLRLHALHSR